MITLKRTTSDNPDFQELTRLFDEYLVDIDGDEKDFFAQYNQIYIAQVVVCYDNETAVGCGAFKQLEPQTAEIKSAGRKDGAYQQQTRQRNFYFYFHFPLPLPVSVT